MGLFRRTLSNRPVDLEECLFFVKAKNDKQSQRTGIACAVEKVVRGEKKYFLLTCTDVKNKEGNISCSRCYSKSLFPWFKKKRNSVEVGECFQDANFCFIPLDCIPEKSLKLVSPEDIGEKSVCSSYVITQNKSFNTIKWQYNRDTQRHQLMESADLEDSSALGSPVLWTDDSISCNYVVGVVSRTGENFFPNMMTTSSLQLIARQEFPAPPPLPPPPPPFDLKTSLFFVKAKNDEQTQGAGIACAVEAAVRGENKYFLLTCTDVKNKPGRVFAHRCYPSLSHTERNKVEVGECFQDANFCFIPLDCTPEKSLKLVSPEDIGEKSECSSYAITQRSFKTIHWQYSRDAQRHQLMESADLEDSSALGSPVIWTDNTHCSYVVGVVSRTGGIFSPDMLTTSSLLQLIEASSPPPSPPPNPDDPMKVSTYVVVLMFILIFVLGVLEMWYPWLKGRAIKL